jgi:hypothetical protein
MRKLIVFTSIMMLAFSSFAQIRKIPDAVTNAFTRQYPKATAVAYNDNLVHVRVYFTQDSARWIAKYDNDGIWKETERQWNYDSLAPEVKDGFMKSKYATDWKVKETSIIYLPNGHEQYRVLVEKNDVQKKYLFFDKNGRLERDALTI